MTVYFHLALLARAFGILFRIGWDATPWVERVTQWLIELVCVVATILFAMTWIAISYLSLGFLWVGVQAFALGKRVVS